MLQQCAKLKAGATRAEVYRIFDEPGGLYGAWDLELNYISCTTVHVHVKFTKVDSAEKKKSPGDTICDISPPFLRAPFDD